MAYNTVVIKKDADNKPIPQYFNPVTDEYEVLQGVGGAARQVLYGPDGQPISVVDNKLAVRAAELETKIEAVRVLLNALAGKDFATQTTLAQILEKMIAAPATEAKQDIIAGHVDGVETLLTALKEKDFATQATLATVLERLQAVERKIDGITDGTAPAKTELTGSIATTISSPITGIKTVTATAAEVFAGATRKANRRKLIIRNEDPVLRFRVGKSDVTQQNGFPVEPGATIIFEFDPKTAVPIYAISEGAALKVGVYEE